MAYRTIDPKKLTAEQRALWDFYDMGGPLGPNVTRGHAEAELHYMCSLEGCPLDDDVYVTVPERPQWTHYIPANLYGRLVQDGRRHHADGVEALTRGDSVAARGHFAASVAASEEAAAFALAHARKPPKPTEE